jgi:hypothetical protein
MNGLKILDDLHEICPASLHPASVVMCPCPEGGWLVEARSNREIIGRKRNVM